MGAIGQIAGGIGGVVDAITGNTPKEKLEASSEARSRTEFFGPGRAERAREDLLQKVILGDVETLGRSQAESIRTAQNVSDEFRNLLIDFLQKDPNVTPNSRDIQRASRFVDQTFTEPATLQLNRSIEDFKGQQQARAAQLGRQDTDLGFQQELFQNILRGQESIQAERSARIQERADQILAAENAGRLQQLEAGRVGTGFFTDRASSLLGNRLNLLNLASLANQQAFRERVARGEQIDTSTGQKVGFIQPTTGGRIAAGGEGAFNVGSGIAGFINPGASSASTTGGGGISSGNFNPNLGGFGQQLGQSSQFRGQTRFGFLGD